MLVRGKLAHWLVKPDGDDLWNTDDWGRAKTYEARWISKGVSESERAKLIPCIVWLKKFPGTQFRNDIMDRLSELDKN